MKNSIKISFLVFLLIFVFISCKKTPHITKTEKTADFNLKLESLNVDQLVQKGNSFFIARRYKMAMAYYNEALKKNYELPIVHFNIGLIYDNTYDYDKAMEQYRIAISEKPDYIKAHLNLAVILGNKKKYDEAMKEINYVLKKQPDNLRALYNRALILHKTQSPDAIKAWKYYIEKAKDDPTQIQNLNKAVLYLQYLEDEKS